MSGSDESIYFGREQTLIKHTILQKYLERFAIIVGKHYNAITYIDGFSGPWESQSEKMDDTSFSIALQQLRSARKIVKEEFKHDFRIRCFFVEEKSVMHLLNERKELSYDEIFSLALSYPYVFKQDLDGWLNEEDAEIVGKKARERVAKVGKGYLVRAGSHLI